MSVFFSICAGVGFVAIGLALAFFTGWAISHL
jgi:hypothetical protein